MSIFTAQNVQDERNQQMWQTSSKNPTEKGRENQISLICTKSSKRMRNARRPKEERPMAKTMARMEERRLKLSPGLILFSICRDNVLLLFSAGQRNELGLITQCKLKFMSSRLDYPHATFNVALSKWPARRLATGHHGKGKRMAKSRAWKCDDDRRRKMRWEKPTEQPCSRGAMERSREQQRKISFEMLM